MLRLVLMLLIVKPLHFKWLIEIYDHMFYSEGRDVCLKSWEIGGIFYAVEKFLEELPNLDPWYWSPSNEWYVVLHEKPYFPGSGISQKAQKDQVNIIFTSTFCLF